MSYLKTIEFLVKEVAKANEQIESLTRKAEDDKSVIDRLSKLHDKYFSEAKSAKDDLDIWKGELDSCSNQLKYAKKDVFELESDLAEMTTEKDHWKEEALEYRDKEREWWSKEKEYKAKIKGLSDTANRFKADYLGEADLVGELEDELTLTKKRYKSLIEQFKLMDKRYQDKIAECQLEINHLKKNK